MLTLLPNSSSLFPRKENPTTQKDTDLESQRRQQAPSYTNVDNSRTSWIENKPT
jgi:hypothetical protein